MISTLQSVTLPSSVHPHIRANTVGDQIEDVLLQQQRVGPRREEEGGPFHGQRDGQMAVEVTQDDFQHLGKLWSLKGDVGPLRSGFILYSCV